MIMKRWAIGFLAFIVSFAAGGMTVRIFTAQNRPQPPPVDQPMLTVQPEPIVPIEEAVEAEANVEFFTDEKRIGRRGKNKVEIKCFDRGDGRVVEIRFFTREGTGWKQKQEFEFNDKDDLTPCDPDVSDFNNDRFGDFTYRSLVAARISNEVRRLFVYDPASDSFIYIKNSHSYPNLLYNKKLNCMTSWMFHGATTTVFLRIDGDELKDFASVDTGADLVVTLRGEHGRKEIYRKRMREDDIYTRYSTFDPPRP